MLLANRDPQHFPDPDRLVLERTERRDVALGQGPHYCLGAPLARLEARIALRELLERHPALEPAGTPRYAPNLNLRMLTALPVSSSPDRTTPSHENRAVFPSDSPGRG